MLSFMTTFQTTQAISPLNQLASQASQGDSPQHPMYVLGGFLNRMAAKAFGFITQASTAELTGTIPRSHIKRANQTEEIDPFWEKPEYSDLYAALKQSLSLPGVNITSISDLEPFKDQLVAIRVDTLDKFRMFGNVVKIPLAQFNPIPMGLDLRNRTAYAILTEEVCESILGYPDHMAGANMTVRLPTEPELVYLIDTQTVGGIPSITGGNVNGANWEVEYHVLRVAAQRQLDQFTQASLTPVPTQPPQDSRWETLLGVGGAAASLLVAYGAHRCYLNHRQTQAENQAMAEDEVPMLEMDEPAADPRSPSPV